jgi:tripartite-type tricarboxylate transporter receptor subunit TctC
LGQTVIVENKPGASGQVGTQFVQKAAPDGTTILCAVDHSLIVVPLTVPDVHYDAMTDFVALGQAVRTYWTLLLPPNGPYRDFKEYAAALKRDPAQRSYGVPLTGGATAVVGDAIGKYAGVEMVPVPFQGSAPVLQNVMGGQVPSGVTGMPEAVSASKGGKARVVAVSGATRTSLLPDVPTFKELGIDGLEFHTFVGFFAPKGLPPQMAQEFNAALRKALNDPATQDKILQLALQPAPTTLEQASREVDDIERFWKKALASKN